jgi:hypothetical protein
MIGKSKEGLALQSLCFQRQVAKEAELKDFWSWLQNVEDSRRCTGWVRIIV